MFVRLLLGLLLLAADALATTANDVCSASADPCVVDRTIAVTADSVLDFGTRALEIRRTGTLDIGTGSVTILAGSVRLVAGASILGRGATVGTLLITTTGAITVEATGTTQSRIDVSGDAAGGRIELHAGGPVTLAGAVTARGTTTNANGGTIIAVAVGNLGVTGILTATGGSQVTGGTVDLSCTGDLSVDDVIDASGGTGGGGSISLDGGTVTTTDRLDASARTGSGDGGSIDITATGNIAVRGAISAGSACGTTSGCSSTGGDVSLDSGGVVTIAAPVTLSGAGPDGTGGTFEVDAGTDVVQSGAIALDGKGSDGCGGEVDITAGRNVTLGAMDLSGGFCGGGTLSVDADGAVTAPAEITLDSRTTGAGGEVTISGETASLSGRLHANGVSLTGGTITVDACGIDVPAGAQIQTRGAQGLNQFSASGQMTIGGLLASGTGTNGAGGRNELRFRDPATPPAVLGTASIVPSATIVNVPTLPRCGGLLPPGCGNNQLDPGEACDDGNTTPCDGCSATCALEGCGNGRQECAETCDDSNTTACDGCSATCRVERCGNGVRECAEECDAGASNGLPGSGCDATCHVPPPPGCGNGTRDAGEECDDGNTTPCDGCSATCRIEGCGNGDRECAEECDDANVTACDGCTGCMLETCGNGVRECDEECDDGPDNGTPSADCDLTCHRAVLCGPGNQDPACVACTSETECDVLGRCAGAACVAGVCTAVGVADCGDGNPGTLDSCSLDPTGAPVCTHTCLGDSGCGDGNLCNGTERCVDGACVPGDATESCDDGDPCTADTCDPATGCTHARPTGLDAVTCPVAAMQAAVDAASSDDLKPRVRRILVGRLGRLRRRADAVVAAETSGDVGQEVRQLRRLSSQIVSVGEVVGRARRRGRMSATLGDRLALALTGVHRAAGELQANLTR